MSGRADRIGAGRDGADAPIWGLGATGVVRRDIRWSQQVATGFKPYSDFFFGCF